MRYKNAVLVHNQKAGEANDKLKLQETIPELALQVEQLSIIQTTNDNSPEAICKRYGNSVDLFIIMGGDGTVNRYLNGLALLERKPVILILPAGTCNDFSRSLDIPQKLNKSAELIANGKEKQIDIAKVNDRFFMNFAGIGLVSETSENINVAHKDRLGVFSYMISALKTLPSIKPFKVKLELDGIEKQEELIMVLVMNGNTLGTRKIPVQSISMNDGQLDLLLVKDSNITMLKEWITMNKPWVNERNLTEIDHIPCEKINLYTESPMKVDTDGELLLTTPLNIKVIPKAFTILSN